MRRPDSKRQLIDYFKKNLTKNYTTESLKFALEKQGYSRSAIDQAYEAAAKEMAEKAPVLREKPVIKHIVYDQEDKPIVQEKFTRWEKLRHRLKGNKIPRGY